MMIERSDSFIRSFTDEKGSFHEETDMLEMLRVAPFWSHFARSLPPSSKTFKPRLIGRKARRSTDSGWSPRYGGKGFFSQSQLPVVETVLSTGSLCLDT